MMVLQYNYDDFIDVVGKRLRALRIDGGYTQRSFALAHGWSYSHWALVERGKKMTLRNLIHAANSFEMSVEELIADAVRSETGAETKRGAPPRRPKVTPGS